MNSAAPKPVALMSALTRKSTGAAPSSTDVPVRTACAGLYLQATCRHSVWVSSSHVLVMAHNSGPQQTRMQHTFAPLPVCAGINILSLLSLLCFCFSRPNHTRCALSPVVQRLPGCTARNHTHCRPYTEKEDDSCGQLNTEALLLMEEVVEVSLHHTPW